MQGLATLPQTARTLASFGRHEDEFLVHAAKGETVVPMAVLNSNPRLKELLFSQMRLMDLEPERYIVGNELNSINPVTGQPEFFLSGIFNNIKGLFKSAAPVLGAVAGSFIPGVGPIIGPALGSFAASKLTGRSTRDSLLNAGIAGVAGGVLGSAGLGGYTNDSGNFLGIGNSQTLGSAGLTGLSNMFHGGSLFGGAAPTAGGIASVGGGGSNILSGSSGTNTLAGGTGTDTLSNATGSAQGATQAATPVAQSAQVQKLVDAVNSPTTQALTKAGIPIEKALSVQGISLNASNNSSGILGGIGSWMKDNPLMSAGLIGGGLYMLNNMEKPQQTPAQNAWTGPSANDLLQQQPSRYAFNPHNFGMARGGAIFGPGGPKTDSIPARLSDGEFVMTADAVKGMGDGDRIAGAKRMYQLMQGLEARSGKK